MTTHRFRVKFEHDPTSLWRDIVVGADRTIDEWRSYAILKEIDGGEPSDKEPEVMNEKREPVEQYGRSSAGW